LKPRNASILSQGEETVQIEACAVASWPESAPRLKDRRERLAVLALQRECQSVVSARVGIRTSNQKRQRAISIRKQPLQLIWAGAHIALASGCTLELFHPSWLIPYWPMRFYIPRMIGRTGTGAGSEGMAAVLLRM
jgi:hypothetical protein